MRRRSIKKGISLHFMVTLCEIKSLHMFFVSVEMKTHHISIPFLTDPVLITDTERLKNVYGKALWNGRNRNTPTSSPCQHFCLTK